MTIHSESMAVISTAHLPEDEAGRLNLAIEGSSVIGMCRDEGWLVYTNQPHEAFATLAYVQGYMLAKGFKWLMFDCDAPATDELPTYEW